MKFTQHQAAYFLAWYIHFVKSQVSSEATSQFPAIYVAAGSVDCGSSLVPDICSQLPDPINDFFPNVTTPLTWTVQLTVQGSQELSSSTFYYTPVVDVPCSIWLPLTRTSLETGYTPTVIVPGVTHSMRPVPKTARKIDEDSLPDAALDIVHRFGITEQHVKKERRGYYDYDSCNGSPPDHDMVTNSLVDVCHFVANAKSYFVSLRPTNAAYMPSWVGFLFQLIVCIWNLILLVSLHTLLHR
jgi:hypothetical protein